MFAGKPQFTKEMSKWWAMIASMPKTKTHLNPHLIAYGIALLLVTAGTILILLIYNVATGFAEDNFERVSFGILLLIGLPLVFLGEFGAGFMERRWSVSRERLDAIGFAFLFANFVAISDLAEGGLTSVRLVPHLVEVAFIFAALWLFYLVWHRCRSWISTWWARRKDEKTSR